MDSSHLPPSTSPTPHKRTPPSTENSRPSLLLEDRPWQEITSRTPGLKSGSGDSEVGDLVARTKLLTLKPKNWLLACLPTSLTIASAMSLEYHETVTMHRLLLLKNHAASFLDMYLTQPPVTSILFYLGEDNPFAPAGFWLENPLGVTVKDLLQMLRPYLLPHAKTLPTLCFIFERCMLRVPDAWRSVFDAGIPKFEKLERKVGAATAFKIGCEDNKHSGRDLGVLLEGDNLDKVVAMGKVNAIAMGASIPEVLAEFERMHVCPS